MLSAGSKRRTLAERRRRRGAGLILAGVAAIALAACGGGGSSGGGNLSSKSASQIVAAAGKAIYGVKSVHVSGTVNSGGAKIGLDLDLASGKGGTGTLTDNGLSVQLIVIGKTLYINGSPAFWRHFGGAAAATLFHGKWLKTTTAASGAAGSFADLINLHLLFGKLLKTHSSSLAKGKTTTIDGQSVIAIRDTKQGGTLYVATSGTPYPVEIQKTGSQAGRISFSKFNESVSLSAPSPAISLSQLEK
jgi:hypothetical protein